MAHAPNPDPDDRSSGRPPGLPRVALRAFFAVLVAVLIVVVGVAAFVEWTARSATPSDGGELSSTARAQLTLVEQRLEALSLAAASLAGQPGLPGALETAEQSAAGAPTSQPSAAADAAGAALEPLLRDLLDNRGLDLAVIAGPGGVPLALAGSDEQAARELVGAPVAVRALEQGRARGAWRRDGKLYLSAAARVERDFETLGLVVVAAPIDRALALEARSLSRADAAFLVPATGGGVEQVASTLGRDQADELAAALAGAGLLEPALRDGRTASTETLNLADRSYRAQVEPLPSPDSRAGAGSNGAARGAGARGAQGVMVTLVQRVGAAPLVRRVELVAAAAGLAGLLLGGLLALLAGRGASAPLDEVTAAAERARSGDLAGASRYPVPGALSEVFADQSEKWSLEAAVAAVGREAGLDRDGGHVERRRGAVLVVEMPRYGRLGPDDEPREVAERLARDVVRVRRAVTGRGGRVEAALGHRVLATFGGDRTEARAVAAGAEILQRLSERENAFDEPVPPAVAVTSGETVVGGPDGARTVTGLPVQQAESLLREAASGDLILSKGVHRGLQEALAAGGVELNPQRGLLTPQPVFLLDTERAARAAAALGEAGAATGGSLSALAPGMVLADRFELAERLDRWGRAGSAALSVDFLARDRQADAVVVVRALRRELLADLSPFEELDSEIRGVMRAVDPAVARVVALGLSDGVPFLASELAEGPTLARVLAVQRFLAPAGALRLARHLAAGLAAIHGTSIPHGDLRPETVVLSPRGNARIIGLGVAPLLPPPGTDPDVDRVFGSPRFLAPERVRGERPSAAADVWAAGALLVEVFTGRPVYGEGGAAERPADWQEVRERIASGPREALDPTELPEGLAPVLERCLAREPSERYAHGGELAAALVGIRAAVVQG